MRVLQSAIIHLHRSLGATKWMQKDLGEGLEGRKGMGKWLEGRKDMGQGLEGRGEMGEGLEGRRRWGTGEMLDIELDIEGTTTVTSCPKFQFQYNPVSLFLTRRSRWGQPTRQWCPTTPPSLPM